MPIVTKILYPLLTVLEFIPAHFLVLALRTANRRDGD
jgi:hypothetical protein